MLSNAFHGCPRIAFTVVDARDVAKAFATCIERPVEGRFILAGRAVWWREIVEILATAFPERRFASRSLPDWLVSLVALFDPRINVKFLRKNLGKRFEYDTSKADRELGPSTTPLEASVIDTARSMIELGLPGAGAA
jgi:dihydroflavonol-4-reductase